MNNYNIENEDERQPTIIAAYTRNPDKCPYCDKEKELWWMPNSGGLRQCIYCPECGKQL